MKKATFAAGCFWHVEEIFSKTSGVKSTKVGYTGGHLENPTYEQFIQTKKEAAQKHIPKYPPKRKKTPISEWLEGLFKDREKAFEEGDLEEVKEITKQITKHGPSMA